VTFGLQPPARPDAIEVAVNVELQQIAGRVAGTARRLRLDATEPGSLEIETVDKGVDEADWIIGGDVIVDRLRQKQELRSIQTGNVRHARF
jgi:hypothetical protein